MGRKPVDRKTLKLRGAYRPSRHGDKSGPEYETTALPCRDQWMSDIQKMLWNELIPKLGKVNNLHTLDSDLILRYVTNLELWFKCVDFIKQNGLTYEIRDAAGNVRCAMPWPQVSLMTKLEGILLKIEKQFLMSPVAREAAGFIYTPELDREDNDE